ncbi:OmpA family protein [Ideonella livida]|uniref:OmpA family protein n=1 Tax=Ideonella livida TaxID=2707176 RepID=A0A7C9PID5_9BURK|nr:OmpA family protein [Ideonella livida]NDY92568.1 OmpA family protein [Ideonella livida]
MPTLLAPLALLVLSTTCPAAGLLQNPSVQDLRAALAPATPPANPLARSFTRTQPPTQDGLCPGAGASEAAPGTRSAGTRNLEVVAYAPEAPHVDLAIGFANDSDAVSPASRALLDKLAQALRSPDLDGKRFVIAGHTSDTGPRDRNLQLSCARAIAVRRHLIKAGVAADRLAAYGFGPDKPLADTEPAADANRRVEIRLSP